MSLIASSHITLVLGLGVTGLSVARFLANQGKTFWLADNGLSPQKQAQIQAEFPGVRLIVDEFDCRDWQGVSEIVLSPGIPRRNAAVVQAIADGISVIGDIDIFAREAEAPIAAITGSNGKTTVTHLLTHMAQTAGIAVGMGGNVGTPALDLLAHPAQLYVLELSSFQLESTRQLNARAATILNVSPDHMDRYDSLAQYHLAKQRVFFGAQHLVINRDDALTHPPLAQHARVSRFGLGEPDLKDFGIRKIEGQPWLCKGLQSLMPVDQLTLRGSHNWLNALAALAMGEALDLPMTAMLDSLRAFQGLPHRCQWVSRVRGVEYINDSKATNIGATVAALKGLASFDGRPKIVLIAGGDGKGADFTELQTPLLRHVKALVTLGRDGQKIADLCTGKVPVQRVVDMAQAVLSATAMASEGDTVLLSPACASLDMFENYEDRGRQFCQQVESL